MTEFYILGQGDRQLWWSCREIGGLAAFLGEAILSGPGPLEGGSGWLAVGEHSLWVRKWL